MYLRHRAFSKFLCDSEGGISRSVEPQVLVGSSTVTVVAGAEYWSTLLCSNLYPHSDLRRCFLHHQLSSDLATLRSTNSILGVSVVLSHFNPSPRDRTLCIYILDSKYFAALSQIVGLFSGRNNKLSTGSLLAIPSSHFPAIGCHRNRMEKFCSNDSKLGIMAVCAFLAFGPSLSWENLGPGSIFRRVSRNSTFAKRN